MSNLREQIRSFVMENFLFGQDPGSLKDDTSFIENGIVDSTGVLELVAFVENTYGLRISNEELVPENLDSIQNLAAFLERKRDGNSASA